ncbi:hypothetical protein AB6N16_14320 [Pseudomonas marginalis]
MVLMPDVAKAFLPLSRAGHLSQGLQVEHRRGQPTEQAPVGVERIHQIATQ